MENACKPVTVVAHRGGAGLAPENTLTAFRSAVALGVAAVECDVHLSRDGRLVVIHDATLERTTDGAGEVCEKTYAELQRLNAAAHFGDSRQAEPIPSLDTVLEVVKGHVRIQIEIKESRTRYPDIEEKVLDAIHTHQMTPDVMVISFDFATINKVKELDARIATGAIIVGIPEDSTPEQFVRDIFAQTHADYLLIYYVIANEALIHTAHTIGMCIEVWTVNDQPTMQRMVHLGVDAIATDRPDLLLKVLARDTPGNAV